MTRSKDIRFVVHGWIKYVEIYIKYKRIGPRSKRKLKLQDLTTGKLSPSKCLENAANTLRTYAEPDHNALMRLGRLFLTGPLADWNKAEDYLKRSLDVRETEFAHHQLSRLYGLKLAKEQSEASELQKSGRTMLVGKCENAKFLSDLRGTEEHFRRAPRHPLAEKQKIHLQRANKLAMDSSAMILTDLARSEYILTDEFDGKMLKQVRGLLNHALCTKKSMSRGDRASAFMHLGMISNAFGERDDAKEYLKISVQEASSLGVNHALPVLQKMLEDNLKTVTDTHAMKLFESLEQPPFHNEDDSGQVVGEDLRNSDCNNEVLDYLKVKMHVFAEQNEVQSAFVCVLLLGMLRDLDNLEKEFAISTAVAMERFTHSKGVRDALPYPQLFRMIMEKGIENDLCYQSCKNAEEILHTLQKEDIQVEKFHRELASRLVKKTPTSGQFSIEDICVQVESIRRFRMRAECKEPIHLELYKNLKKSSVAFNHDILVFSSESESDQENATKIVKFIEIDLGLSEYCCWAQRDLVHNICGREYDVSMSTALRHSRYVVIYLTHDLLLDYLDCRILSSVVSSQGRIQRLVLVEAEGDGYIEQPMYRRLKESFTSIPMTFLEYSDEKTCRNAKRKFLQTLLLA